MRTCNWILALALTLLAAPAFSATYYIDFSTGSDANAGTSKGAPWKRAPGMKGFSGTYTHAAGDQFMFKGGVTWDSTIAPWYISNSGASATPDYYGVDKTWYTGAGWTNPVFDGGSHNPVVASPYFSVTGSYVTLDSLQVQNIGVAGTSQSNYAVEFINDHNITTENMVMPVESRIAIYVVNYSGGTLGNFNIENNDLSKCSVCVTVGVAAPNSIITGVSVHNNSIHDLHDQLATGEHGDGIFIFGAGGGDTSQYVQSPTVYSNHFYGDFSRSDASAAGMTAMIFFDYNLNGTILVYNNYGYDTASNGGYFVWIEPTSGLLPTAEVLSNSFAADTNGGWFGFLLADTPLSSLVSEDNIFTGGTNGYGAMPFTVLSSLTSDYNDFYNQSNSCWVNETNGAGCVTYPTFVGQGFERHGLGQAPHFVSATDLFLSPPSPAMGSGVNLSSMFSVDAGGNPRPPAAAWDVGAYQSPAAPTSLAAEAQ